MIYDPEAELIWLIAATDRRIAELEAEVLRSAAEIRRLQSLADEAYEVAAHQ